MGLFSLKEKILIAPVGMYKERLRKSILNSGAQRVYLIKESKGELKEITEDIATIYVKNWKAIPSKSSTSRKRIFQVFKIFIIFLQK
jgi:hypothetical protein